MAWSSSNSTTNTVIGNLVSGGSDAEYTQAAHGFAVGNAIYHNGTAWAKSIASAVASSKVYALVSEVGSVNTFKVKENGQYISGLSGLTAGSIYYLSSTTAGTLTATAPSANGTVVVKCLLASSTTSGYIQIAAGEQIGAESFGGVVESFVNFNTSEPAHSPGSFYINTATGTGSTTTGTTFTANYIYYSDGTNWFETVPSNGTAAVVRSTFNSMVFDSAVGWKFNKVIISAWQASREYPAGSLVYHPGIADCVISSNGHTSGATFNLTELGNWDVVGQVDYASFVASTLYPAGFVIAVSGKVYKRTADGTSGATFDTTEEALWSEVAQNYTETRAWAASTVFRANELYRTTIGTGNGQSVEVTLRNTTDRTTGATFDATELSNSVFVSQSHLADTFPASTLVPRGYKMYLNGTLWQRDTAGTTTAAFNATEIADWDRLNSVPRIGAFQASTYVESGDICTVTFGSTTVYVKANSSHTTAATYTVTEAASWDYIGQSSIPAFQSSAVVNSGVQIIQNGALIQRSTTGTSGATFDATESSSWDGAHSRIVTWAAASYIYLYQLVRLSTTKILQRTAASGAAGASFDATEAAKYSLVGNIGVNDYVNGEYYYVGEQAYHLGTLITRSVAGLTSTAMDATEAGNWTVENIHSPTVFSTATFYFANQLVYVNDHVYKRSSNGVSGSAFDASEAGQWSLIIGDAIAPAWSATKYIHSGEIRTTTIAGASVTIQCITSHYSAATLTVGDLANWRLVAQHSTGSFSATAPILEGIEFLEDGVRYKRVSTGTTAATFTAAERDLYTVVYSTTKVQSFTASGTAARFDGYATCNPTAAMTLTLPEQVSKDIGRKYTVNNISNFDVTVAVTVGTIDADSIVKANSVRTFIVTSATVVSLAEAYKPIYSVQSISANYTALATDDIILIDTAGGNVTLTLPTTFKSGKLIVVNKPSAANTVTISTGANQIVTLIGTLSTSITMSSQYSNFPLFWTGSVWTFLA